MKLKKIIREIEMNSEPTITIDKERYIALLREVNRLRLNVRSAVLPGAVKTDC